jgi:predicted branched-subunit amino acid permease
MPSPKRGYIVAALVLIGVSGLAYSVVLARALIGAGFALSALVVAVLVYYGDAERRTLVRATIAVTVVYGVFTVQLPLAVVAACVVYLSAWLTGPDSPFDAPDTEIFPVRRAATEESEGAD